MDLLYVVQISMMIFLFVSILPIGLERLLETIEIRASMTNQVELNVRPSPVGCSRRTRARNGVKRQKRMRKAQSASESNYGEYLWRS